MSSFINDQRAVMEPYSDLPAMTLAVVGFIVFIGIVTQVYVGFQEKAFIAEHYQDAANLARKLSRDSSILGSSDIIDASKIEGLDSKEFVKKYGIYYNFILKVEAKSESRTYFRIIKDPDITESKSGVSASLPVTIKINDVEELPGVLTVKLWRK
ncbi:MAG: hypothetical protein J5U16_03750 [Candidatus Methanoperedens sp.]|nr:hypothetical protein [Candidatus Methanoperedens sp.]